MDWSNVMNVLCDEVIHGMNLPKKLSLTELKIVRQSGMCERERERDKS